MSADEAESWKVYNSISPIGPLRADLRSAIVAQTMANCHISRGQRAFKRTDFMPFWEAPKQTDDEIGTRLLAWAKQTQAAIDHKNRKQKRNG